MAKCRPRLLFYFLHLLGVGHVYRAKRLIESLAQQGISVDVIYGGEPIPGMTFEAESVHFLPPIKSADNAFSSYLDENGQALGEAFLKRRQEILLAVFDDLDPDCLLIEAFPFGRRMVRHEIAALIDAASQRSPKPLIVSSVRDILQERKKAGRIEETRNWIKSQFDHVLVHSDPYVIKLDETFPLAHEVASQITYTGFVVPHNNNARTQESFDVIVTAGGGAFGGDLMRVAAEAARAAPADQTWCLAVGHNAETGLRESLQAAAPPNVTVREQLDNLSGHMKLARVSVSQCGYNTAMDVLSVHQTSACRAVFVPYDTEGQSEQLRRAELLEKAGFAINLPQSRLTAGRLLEAVDRAARLPRVAHDVDFSGASNTADIVCGWLDCRAEK